MESALPSQPVAVVTGATSGIGRATAIALARRRSRLMLTARDTVALREVREKCLLAEARDVMVQACDMADRDAVQRVATSAADKFGRVDVWINSAAVLVFGKFEDVPAEDFEQVVQANLLGYANGCRAALRQFRMQGNRGVLINVSSMLGVFSEPYVSAYVATKFAIRGLSGCLRQELRDEPHMHVCTVLPAAIDTPIYQKAGNYVGRKARSIFPVYSPELAAKTIVKLVFKPADERRVGGLAHLLAMSARVAPNILENAVGRVADKVQFSGEPCGKTAGNLYETSPPRKTFGGWREYWRNILLGSSDGSADRGPRRSPDLET